MRCLPPRTAASVPLYAAQNSHTLPRYLSPTVSITIPSMPPLLLGHRGARATRSIPENTIASFDLALAHGCDGFEFDVRLTADGGAVICHDPKIHGVEIAAAAATDLRDLPVLDQVLARYQDKAFLDIEVKVAGVEAIVIRALEAHPPRRGFVVSSFLPEVLLAMRHLAPDVSLGLICETPAELAAWTRLPVHSVMPHFTLMNVDLMQELRGAGKKVLTWTVNRKEMMLEFERMNVDGIISDDTVTLGQLRAPNT
jgi:glycerophosphoryl diester phosphodiesterase